MFESTLTILEAIYDLSASTDNKPNTTANLLSEPTLESTETSLVELPITSAHQLLDNKADSDSSRLSLWNTDSSSLQRLNDAAEKQRVLIENDLFDPHSYFGNGQTTVHDDPIIGERLEGVFDDVVITEEEKKTRNYDSDEECDYPPETRDGGKGGSEAPREPEAPQEPTIKEETRPLNPASGWLSRVAIHVLILCVGLLILNPKEETVAVPHYSDIFRNLQAIQPLMIEGVQNLKSRLDLIAVDIKAREIEHVESSKRMRSIVAMLHDYMNYTTFQKHAQVKELLSKFDEVKLSLNGRKIWMDYEDFEEERLKERLKEKEAGL